MQNKHECLWQIVNTKLEAPDVMSLYLEPKSEKPIFKAGQYLTIKIPELGPTEGKAYSISSAPHEEFVRVTVRKIGQFSSALSGLNVGDSLTTSRPYGYFYPEPEDTTDLVFVVGGIGITPCMSIIMNLVHTGSTRKIHLLYSNQTEADIVFKDELATFIETNPLISVHHFITRETPKTEGFFSGRISPTDVTKLVPNFINAEFFICGSADFTKSLWKELHNTGITQHQLYTEGFF